MHAKHTGTSCSRGAVAAAAMKERKNKVHKPLPDKIHNPLLRAFVAKREKREREERKHQAQMAGIAKERDKFAKLREKSENSTDDDEELSDSAQYAINEKEAKKQAAFATEAEHNTKLNAKIRSRIAVLSGKKIDSQSKSQLLSDEEKAKQLERQKVLGEETVKQLNSLISKQLEEETLKFIKSKHGVSTSRAFTRKLKSFKVNNGNSNKGVNGWIRHYINTKLEDSANQFRAVISRQYQVKAVQFLISKGHTLAASDAVVEDSKRELARENEAYNKELRLTIDKMNFRVDFKKGTLREKVIRYIAYTRKASREALAVQPAVASSEALAVQPVQPAVAPVVIVIDD